MTLTTLKIVLGLISLANALSTWLSRQKDYDTGHDAAVAQATLQLLETTKQGKTLRESIKKLSDTDSDRLWDDMLNA